jgi:pimeloyl-ACP methyl ester carboxylesterase
MRPRIRTLGVKLPGRSLGRGQPRAFHLAILLMAAVVSTPSVRAQSSDVTQTTRNAVVDGIILHYTIAGRGPAVILLHGYAETSRMWGPVLPLLAKRFTVIAPDLPGIGDSEIPSAGLDMRTAAIRIHALARSLGIDSAEVVGHDIGLMVAYAYAAQFPGEVRKLVVMDAFLPGVGAWQTVYDDPTLWHFRFSGRTPEALVAGRERTYFEHFWNDFAADATHSVPEEDREAYAAAYARPGRIRAAWAYFESFPQTARDFARLAVVKLPMPVLSIGGDKSLGAMLGDQMKLVASDVTVVVLKNAGHWILEEQPAATIDALARFL